MPNAVYEATPPAVRSPQRLPPLVSQHDEPWYAHVSSPRLKASLAEREEQIAANSVYISTKQRALDQRQRERVARKQFKPHHRHERTPSPPPAPPSWKGEPQKEKAAVEEPSGRRRGRS